MQETAAVADSSAEAEVQYLIIMGKHTMVGTSTTPLTVQEDLTWWAKDSFLPGDERWVTGRV